MQEAKTNVQKKMKVGLGEAIQRLLKVEMLLINGVAEVEEHAIAERQMIIDALNLTQLELGFDCDDDGTPDTVEIFQQAAETSCCRVISSDDVPAPPKARGSSRVKDEPPPVKTSAKKKGVLSTLFGGDE